MSEKQVLAYRISERLMRAIAAIALEPPVKRSPHAYRAVVSWDLIETVREELGLGEEKLKEIKALDKRTKKV